MFFFLDVKRIKLEPPVGECSNLPMTSATSTSSMISKHFASQVSQPMMIVSNGNGNERFQQQTSQPAKQNKMHSFAKQPQTQYVNVQKPTQKQNTAEKPLVNQMHLNQKQSQSAFSQQQIIQQKIQAGSDSDDSEETSQIIYQFVKDDNGIGQINKQIVKTKQPKTPPWKKNSILNQTRIQQSQVMTNINININNINSNNLYSVINNEKGQSMEPQPIYQLQNQQLMSVDPSQSSNQHQNFQNTQQQAMPFSQDQTPPWKNDEPKLLDKNNKIIPKRRPTFKEDPTGYLNQQTALLHNSISTLHSPSDGSSSTSSPALNEAEYSLMIQQQNRNQATGKEQTKPTGSNMNLINSTTLGGQTVTQLGNGVVQIQQNCDIPLQIQHQIQQQQNKYIRQTPKSQGVPNRVGSKQTVQNKRFVSVSQESPSSTTTAQRDSTPDISSSCRTPDSIQRDPVQTGGVTTSYESPRPIESPEPAITYVNTSSTIYGGPRLQTGQTNHKNTITSVIAGKTITNTTSTIRRQTTGLKKAVTQNQQQNVEMIVKEHNNITIQNMNKSNINAGSTTNMSPMNLQQQPNGNQFMMTSTGQILMMPTSQPNQIKQINQPMIQLQNQQIPQQVQLQNNGTIMMGGQNLVLNNNGTLMQIQNNSGQRLIPANGNNVLIQTGNGNVLAPLNGNNFMMNSNAQMSPIILNNGNIIQQQNGQNIISTGAGGGKNIIQSNNGNILLSTGNGGKAIITANNQILTANNGIISSGSNNMLGQQMMLGGLQNNMVMQPNFTRIDGQQSMIINPDGSIVQQSQQRHITISPEKKKGRKRKMPIETGGIHQQIQQQIQSQQTQGIQSNQDSGVFQLSPQFSAPQSYQISPNMQGMTLMQNKNPQQLILQNGQIIQQPQLNLLGQQLGQQLILPPNLVVAQDNSLMQIQNMNNACGGLIATPQGMIIRAPAPQQKTLITNNGQQFIVNQNGQISPINQVFSTPMGLILQTQQNQQPQLIQQAAQNMISQPQQPQIIMQHSNGNQQIVSQASNQFIATQQPALMSHQQMMTQKPQMVQQQSKSIQKKQTMQSMVHQQKQTIQKLMPSSHQVIKQRGNNMNPMYVQKTTSIMQQPKQQIQHQQAIARNQMQQLMSQNVTLIQSQTEDTGNEDDNEDSNDSNDQDGQEMLDEEEQEEENDLSFEQSENTNDLEELNEIPNFGNMNNHMNFDSNSSTNGNTMNTIYDDIDIQDMDIHGMEQINDINE